MEAVPLMAYLARRDRDYDEVSRHPKPVDVQAATEAWYDKGLADGRQKAKADCDEAIRRHEEESKAKLDRARRIVGGNGKRRSRPANRKRDRSVEGGN